MLLYRQMNKKLNKLVALTITLMGLVVVGGNSVLAQYGVPYGEAVPSIKIFIDKKIKNPAIGEFVDNLGVNDYRFSPGEEVRFKVRVKNSGEKTFGKVKVKDYLPGYVELVSGPTEVEYKDLKVNESKEFEILVKVVSAEKLPADKGIFCVINKAEVKANDESDEDTAQLCIEKKVLGAAIQPEAGVNLLLLGSSLLGISTLGFFLKRKGI